MASTRERCCYIWMILLSLPRIPDPRRGLPETLQGRTKAEALQVQAITTPESLPGAHSKPERILYRPRQSGGSSKVAESARSKETPRIPRDGRLLPAMHPGVRHYSTPLAPTDCKGRALEMDRRRAGPLRHDAEKHQHCPILGYPDPRRQFILDTDASGCGVGAVLSQVQEGCERVIVYYSKTLTLSERNHCVTRRELLAVVKAVKHFQQSLYGQEFLLWTDHMPLRWLCWRRKLQTK